MSLSRLRLAIFLLVVICIILAVCLVVVLRGGPSEASSTYRRDQVRIVPQSQSNPAECSSEHYRMGVKIRSPVFRSAA
jgi:hypothetical protein